MKPRGYTLSEILVSLVLFGMTGVICIQLILPVFIRASRFLTDSSDGLVVQTAFRLMRGDVASSLPDGLSFVSKDRDWILAVVPLDQGSAEGKKVWQTQLIAYRYDSSAQVLTRQVVSDLRWPDGSSRLNSDAPPIFEPEELWALPHSQARVLARSIQGEAWPSLQANWVLNSQDSRGRPQRHTLNLASFL